MYIVVFVLFFWFSSLFFERTMCMRDYERFRTWNVYICMITLLKLLYISMKARGFLCSVFMRSA